MAEFVPPQFQNPNVLAQYLQGQQTGISAALAPGEMAGQQQGLALGNQQLQTGQLNLDMLRQAMGMKQQMLQSYQQTMSGINGGQSSGGGAQGAGNASGGIQNGPQGAVSQSQPQYDPNDPLAPLLDPRRVAANAAYGQFSAMMSGKDPNEAAQKALDLQEAARKDQINRAQFSAQPHLDKFDSVFNSAAPAKAVMNDPDMMSHWPQKAVELGLAKSTDDPAVWQQFNDTNVRAGLALGANQLRGQVGLPAKDYPVALKNVNLGQGEIGQIDPVTGKKAGDLTERQKPEYTLKDVFDPATNSNRAVPIQTGGFGMQGVNPSAAGAAPPGGGVNLGMKAPTDPELKAAMFGSEMRSGMNTLTKMESQGFSLSPKTRTLLINAATSEDEGVMKQFLSQEGLAHLSQKEQTYVSALMPMLQAAGHDQSGARLTTAQVRQNIESLVPIDVKNKDAMTQVGANRQGFYVGLLGQAGAAAQLPQYKGTLAADLGRAQASASGSAHPANIQALLDKYPKKP